MKRIYDINDIENGMYFAYVDEDGIIQKEGSFLINYFNKETEKMYGRGYRKRESYSIGFHISSFYSESSNSNRALLTSKEFKKGFVGDKNTKFNVKEYIKEELTKAGFEFTKIRFTQKKLSTRAWVDCRGDKYPAEYIMALYIEGHDFNFERNESIKRTTFQKELQTFLADKLFTPYRLEIGWDNDIWTKD